MLFKMPHEVGGKYFFYDDDFTGDSGENKLKFIAQKYQGKELGFVNCEFREMNLEKYPFHDCSFYHCNFDSLCLNQADFLQTSFENCRFENSDLSHSTMSTTNFTHTEWIDCELNPSRFKNSSFLDTRLERTPIPLELDLSSFGYKSPDREICVGEAADYEVQKGLELYLTELKDEIRTPDNPEAQVFKNPEEKDPYWKIYKDPETVKKELPFQYLYSEKVLEKNRIFDNIQLRSANPFYRDVQQFQKKAETMVHSEIVNRGKLYNSLALADFAKTVLQDEHLSQKAHQLKEQSLEKCRVNNEIAAYLTPERRKQLFNRELEQIKETVNDYTTLDSYPAFDFGVLESKVLRGKELEENTLHYLQTLDTCLSQLQTQVYQYQLDHGNLSNTAVLDKIPEILEKQDQSRTSVPEQKKTAPKIRIHHRSIAKQNDRGNSR